MKKLAKDPIALLSLASSIAGIALIYIASTNLQPSYVSISEIDSDMVGRTISTGGYISEVQRSAGGHIFLTIANNNYKIQVAVFSDLAKALEANGIGVTNFTKGRMINATGTLDVYNNQFQIVPRKASDLVID